MQGRLFPLVITRLEPAHTQTADCKLVGLSDDNIPYAIKRMADGPLIPVSEWICTRLAEAVRLPVAPCEIAYLPGGEPAFASRWEGGTVEDRVARTQLFERGAVDATLLTRLFVFDCFVHNLDRHPGNYLFRVDTRSPGPRLLIFDFSRAFAAVRWPLPPLPLPARSNTALVARALLKIHGYHHPTAIATIRQLQSLPDDAMVRLCDPLPPAWLPSGLSGQLDTWWRLGRSARALSVLSELSYA